jgi:hypothetical protein
MTTTTTNPRVCIIRSGDYYHATVNPSFRSMAGVGLTPEAAIADLQARFPELPPVILDQSAFTPAPGRWQLEGLDRDGQWSWSNVSADGIEANTILEDFNLALAARSELVRIYGCDPSEIRLVELS